MISGEEKPLKNYLFKIFWTKTNYSITCMASSIQSNIYHLLDEKGGMFIQYKSNLKNTVGIII